jgi:hypothetical protein
MRAHILRLLLYVTAVGYNFAVAIRQSSDTSMRSHSCERACDSCQQASPAPLQLLHYYNSYNTTATTDFGCQHMTHDSHTTHDTCFTHDLSSRGKAVTLLDGILRLPPPHAL